MSFSAGQSQQASRGIGRYWTFCGAGIRGARRAYIGICAGGYLARAAVSGVLNFINTRTVSPKWQRGKRQVKVELTRAGRTILGERAEQLEALYAAMARWSNQTAKMICLQDGIKAGTGGR